MILQYSTCLYKVILFNFLQLAIGFLSLLIVHPCGHFFHEHPYLPNYHVQSFFFLLHAVSSLLVQNIDTSHPHEYLHKLECFILHLIIFFIIEICHLFPWIIYGK